MSSLTQYIFTLIPLATLDAIWIGFVAKGFYAKHMNFLFSKSINIVPAIMFYPIYAFALLHLAVIPSVSSGSWQEAVIRGAVLGLAAYSAYDLTNHATIAKWPLAMTIVDISWGVFVSSLTCLIAYLIITR